MDHPASGLAIYRRPLDPILVRYTLPGARTLTCGVLRSPSHYLFLGEQWPVNEPDTWPIDLSAVIHADTQVYGLQLYTQMLHEAVNLGVRVDFELERWAAYRRYLMQSLIEPNIDHAGDFDHWLWRPAFRMRHPTINFGGQHDMLVVRLTWALERTSRSAAHHLPPDKNPYQPFDDCPNNSEFRRCVNPGHYGVRWSRRDRRNEAQRAEARANRVVLRGTETLRKANPTDWELKDQFARLTAMHPTNIPYDPEAEAPPVPEVDLVDWSQYPDI